MFRHSFVRTRRALIALLVCALIVLTPLPDAAARAEHCFAESGLCISGRIRAYWEHNGGLRVFGFPITPLRTEDAEGSTIQAQWFERARLELHLENRAPYDVLLGRLGDNALLLQGRDWWREGREVGPKDDCLWFESTGHNICDVAPGVGFLSYWRQPGLHRSALDSYTRSLARFGLPLTEARLEINPDDGQLYLIQWFERARFENHVEQSSGASQVLLGLLGNELLGRTTPRYLWPGAIPAGLVIQPRDTHADNSGFVIVLTQPSGQPGARITGGPGFFSAPPRGPFVPLTVRGQPGTVTTTRGVTFIYWTENRWPYTVSGDLSQDELRAFVEGMDLLPLVRWQERLRALTLPAATRYSREATPSWPAATMAAHAGSQMASSISGESSGSAGMGAPNAARPGAAGSPNNPSGHAAEALLAPCEVAYAGNAHSTESSFDRTPRDAGLESVAAMDAVHGYWRAAWLRRR